MLLLDVKYEDKEKVKKLGARWNPNLKKWYVENSHDYFKFEEWIPASVIISNSIYIVEGITKCWKCGKETKVIAVGIEDHMEISDSENGFEIGEIHIVSGFDGLPTKLIKYICQKYSAVKERYSKTRGGKYLSNGCSHCDALLGDWFLFSEPDSPFFIDSIETVESLVLYKINLTTDLALPISVIYGSEDKIIKANATIVEVKELVL